MGGVLTLLLFQLEAPVRFAMGTSTSIMLTEEDYEQIREETGCTL